jgi:hypothetical protein
MTEFQEGDVVRILQNGYDDDEPEIPGYMFRGQLGIVRKVRSYRVEEGINDVRIELLDRDFSLRIGSGEHWDDWVFYPNELEKVEAEDAA